MNFNEMVKNLDFDIKQIDNTIDILNHLTYGNFLSINGQQTIDSNIKSLGEVQHHLLTLRANLLKENAHSKELQPLKP